MALHKAKKRRPYSPRKPDQEGEVGERLRIFFKFKFSPRKYMDNKHYLVGVLRLHIVDCVVSSGTQ